jgi:ATP-binding cassette subfamily B multidrug efflux pump
MERQPAPCMTLWGMTRGHRKAVAVGAVGLLGVDLLGLIPPYALGLLIDSVTKGAGPGTSTAIAAAYVGVFVLQGLVRYPMKVGFVGTAARAAADLRQRFGDHVAQVGRGSLAGFPAGDLIARASGDIGAVESTLSTGALFFLDCSFHLATVPVVMLLLSPRLSAYAFLAFPLVLVIAHAMVRRITRASEDSQSAFSNLASRAHDNAIAVQTVRAYGSEDREISAFLSAADAYVRKDLRRAGVEAGFAGSVQILIAISLFLTLWLGGREAVAGRITTGQFVTFLQYVGMMAWPLSGLAWAWVLYKKGQVSFERIRAVLDLPALDEESGEPCPTVGGNLEVRDLAFTRPGDSKLALSGVSFSVRAGERVAVVGPTGSGKSTLLDLLSRQLEPPRGTLFLDGQDIALLKLRDLRRHISVAPQEAFLFSGTVRENIAVGSSAGDRIGAAASIAQVGGVEFSNGLGTVVGERGASLSGGQRQRVALARALAKASPILVLDDATSALDEETEERVFRELAGCAAFATVLFATNRTRHARGADRILVLQGGRVAEQGSHADLMAANGWYASWSRKEAWSDALEG